MKQPIALVDCNNFYASCERIFRPDLRGKPIVVLSNNDGCIIARSNEAKALGIKMGAPVFKARPIIQQHRVQMFSANFPFYGDISSRVMHTLQRYSPQIEVYSIDEAFLNLGDLLPDTLDMHGQTIRNELLQTLKVPTSIGIAETKTLAKVAAHMAKHGKGVVNLYQKTTAQEQALRELAVGDVWGVGWRIGDSLRRRGIGSAWELTQADEIWLLRRFGSMLMRTVCELRGTPCYQIEHPTLEQKSITCSRSFGRYITTLADLRQAVVTYTTRAAEKLRQHQQAASLIAVYIHTNRHRKQDAQYFNSSYIPLPTATDCTHELIHHASKGLESIYKSDFRYIKAQITLLGLVSKNALQSSLFDTTNREKQGRLMESIDRLNLAFGQNCLHYASQGFHHSWQMKRENRSPRYTTNWDELAQVT